MTYNELKKASLMRAVVDVILSAACETEDGFKSVTINTADVPEVGAFLLFEPTLTSHKSLGMFKDYSTDIEKGTVTLTDIDPQLESGYREELKLKDGKYQVYIAKIATLFNEPVYFVGAYDISKSDNSAKKDVMSRMKRGDYKNARETYGVVDLPENDITTVDCEGIVVSHHSTTGGMFEALKGFLGTAYVHAGGRPETFRNSLSEKGVKDKTKVAQLASVITDLKKL